MREEFDALSSLYTFLIYLQVWQLSSSFLLLFSFRLERRSVWRCRERCVRRFEPRAAGVCLARNAPLCQGNSAPRCPRNSAPLFLARCANRFLYSAQGFRDKNAGPRTIKLPIHAEIYFDMKTHDFNTDKFRTSLVNLIINIKVSRNLQQ